jgi:hypothetical protein
MIPKDNIFSLFQNEDTIEVYENFMDNPYVKIGMFNKIIKNNTIFNIKFKKFLDSVDPNYDKEYIDSSSKFITFNRAFFYIKDINVENQQHIDALRCHDFEGLILNLNSSISFFEEREEYEKCNHLFKIKKLIEESLQIT